MWTYFYDIESDISQPLLPPWRHIILGATWPVAIKYFKERFGRDPRRHTWTMVDYEIGQYANLEHATKFFRFNLARERYRKESGFDLVYAKDIPDPIPTVEEFLSRSDVLIVRKLD